MSRQEYQLAALNVLLVSTYELGHQPFGLASPARWLRDTGANVRCADLAVGPLPADYVQSADLIAFYVPMHTATRLAVRVARRVTELNSAAHLCFYGLYAPMNERYLRSLGAETILGGEFEEGLAALVQRLSAQRADEREAPGSQAEPLVSLARQRFREPDRSDLPRLDRYARFIEPSGRVRIAGYTEATRGCKHSCRHCPIVPVYGGHFRVVQRDVVLHDVENLVNTGAEHITFGDPDFFNGPAHAVSLVTALHKRFPHLSYDVTIKVEHLVKHAQHIQVLAATGCLLVTSAVESFDDRVLEILDKRHTTDEFARAVKLLRSAGIALNPTFVAFTPYTTLDGYIQFLRVLRDLDLVSSVSPVQYAIRLLLPEGSLLLDLPETQGVLAGFDQDALYYRWSHPDSRMDALQAEVAGQVQLAQAAGATREQIFAEVTRLALSAAGYAHDSWALDDVPSGPAIPRLSEPWYCCAEPTDDQFAALETSS